MKRYDKYFWRASPIPMVLPACRGYLGNPCSPFSPHLFSTLPIILFSLHLFSTLPIILFSPRLFPTLSRYIGLTEQYDRNNLNILGSLQLSALYLFFPHKIGWNFFVLWSSIWVFIYVTLSKPWLCICVFLCGRTLDLPPTLFGIIAGALSP